MAKKKPPQQPETVITLALDPTIAYDDNQVPYQTAVVTANRGDIGFTATVRAYNLEQVIGDVIQKLNTAFFHAEADGLPDFPDMTEAAANADAAPSTAAPSHPNTQPTKQLSLPSGDEEHYGALADTR